MTHLQVGSTITGPSDSFTVEEILGEHTFGAVILCRRTSSDQTVALKVIRRQEHVEEALEETEILQMLQEHSAEDHFIMHWFSSFHSGDTYCLEFEPLDISLADFLDQSGKMSPLQIRPVLFQLSTAFSFLNNLGLMHGDLKSDNIMMLDHKSGLQLKLIDFGGAHYSSHVRRPDVTQTCWYRYNRAPEVRLSTQHTEAIDMWSLGCVALEMISGRGLFPIDKETDILRHIVCSVGNPPDSLFRKAIDSHQSFDQTTAEGALIWTFEQYKCISVKMLSMDQELDWISFVDLVLKLLSLNPETRISPVQVLDHPFITMSHITNVYNTEYVRRGVELMGSFLYHSEERSSSSPSEGPAKILNQFRPQEEESETDRQTQDFRPRSRPESRPDASQSSSPKPRPESSPESSEWSSPVYNEWSSPESIQWSSPESRPEPREWARLESTQWSRPESSQCPEPSQWSSPEPGPEHSQWSRPESSPEPGQWSSPESIQWSRPESRPEPREWAGLESTQWSRPEPSQWSSLEPRPEPRQWSRSEFIQWSSPECRPEPREWSRPESMQWSRLELRKRSRPGPRQRSRLEPRQRSRPEARQRSRSRLEPTEKPRSRPEPRQRSRPEPRQRSRQRNRQRSRPEPRQRSRQRSRMEPTQWSRPESKPEPRQRSRPEPRQRSTLEPTQWSRLESTPEPTQWSRPEPGQWSSPEPRQCSRLESRPESRAEPIQWSRREPRQRSRPEPTQWSRPRYRGPEEDLDQSRQTLDMKRSYRGSEPQYGFNFRSRTETTRPRKRSRVEDGCLVQKKRHRFPPGPSH